MLSKQPSVGSPIACARTRRIIGHWTSNAPSFCAGEGIRLRLLQPMPQAVRHLANSLPDREPELLTMDIWLAFGSQEDQAQVWLTTATEPGHLRGAQGIRPIDECDTAKDATALRRVLAMREVIYDGGALYGHLESYARYLENKARHQ